MILGKRVRLRAIEVGDLSRFVAWLNDPPVIENLVMRVPLSLAQETGWFEAMKKRPPEEHPMVIEINQPEGWKPIGNIGLHEIDWINRHTELGIFIGEKQHWNQGYGRDAIRLVLRYGFQSLNLNRIYLRVFETNPRGIHSYENAGFKLEGRLREDIFLNGKYRDTLIMSVLRSEWQDVEV